MNPTVLTSGSVQADKAAATRAAVAPCAAAPATFVKKPDSASWQSLQGMDPKPTQHAWSSLYFDNQL
eukprot:324563-Amphidinium_carterae.2